ncbi:CPBP family intramembrane glutamic endopeptidase [Romboutsia lituseburensis]|uniref:CPBP family intramembrane glutamic endopeptidase n=1 Tax=Romboutsia lituseburensis TaxID=1537 RepID=UPI0022EB1BAC|nr:CPBP family intramembrane glutamic endopeptidase [Romboutsia lituseburensis]
MSTDIKNIKQEIKYFLLINFVLIAFISVFIFKLALKPDSSMLITNFGGLFMYIPAFSVIVVLKKFSNYKFSSKVDKFLNVFAISTVVRIFASIADVFIFNNIIISSLIDAFVSAYLLYVVMSNRCEFEVLNLSLNKNFKKILTLVLIFLIIIISKFILGIILDGSSTFNIENYKIEIKDAILAIISLITNFCFGFNLFFGEEFGWRYFLQPRIQKIYGKKFGVLILGFIWGIWHLPLCLTLYGPETPALCVINHIAYCMLFGVFLGYVYMTTENIFAPILIHLTNNSVFGILNGGYESILTSNTLLIGIVLNTIFFLPFLFTKVYKSNNIEESSTLDF